jgi:hypothetical protein
MRWTNLTMLSLALFSVMAATQFGTGTGVELRDEARHELVPASTAATAASHSDVRVCRFPRGSRGPGTRARCSARPG